MEVRQGTFEEASDALAVASPIADSAPSDWGSDKPGVATAPEIDEARFRGQSGVATSPGATNMSTVEANTRDTADSMKQLIALWNRNGGPPQPNTLNAPAQVATAGIR